MPLAGHFSVLFSCDSTQAPPPALGECGWTNGFRTGTNGRPRDEPTTVPHARHLHRAYVSCDAPLMSALSIRSATAADVETLFAIRCAVRENHQSRAELAALGIDAESIRAAIERGDYITTIAEIDGRAVGFSMAQISAGYVFATFVLPDHEGRGVGRAVLAAAEDGLRSRGVASAWLSTGADEKLRAVGFYRHLGWVDAGFLPDGQRRFEKALR